MYLMYLLSATLTKFIVSFVCAAYERERHAALDATCRSALQLGIVLNYSRRLGQMPPSRRLRVESKHRRQKGHLARKGRRGLVVVVASNAVPLYDELCDTDRVALT